MTRVKAKDHFLIGLFAIMAVIVCFPVASWATYASRLDFNIDANHNGSGASISYAGGVLSGVNIEVDEVTGLGVGNVVTGGPVAINTGRLNFNALNGTGDVTNGWTFSGGSLTITGGFNGSPIDTQLLSGTFQNVTVSVIPLFSGYQFDIMWGNFTDTKDQNLAEYFFGPSPPNNFIGAMNLSFTTVGATDSAFTTFPLGSVLSGDVFNTPVPVPAAVWLLGSGLLGLLGIRRRMS
jgi:hypothetical protein